MANFCRYQIRAQSDWVENTRECSHRGWRTLAGGRERELGGKRMQNSMGTVAKEAKQSISPSATNRTGCGFTASSAFQRTLWIALAIAASACSKADPPKSETAATRTQQAVVSGLVAAYGFEEGS